MNEEGNPLDDQFDDFGSNQVLQPIENLVSKNNQGCTNHKDVFSYSKTDFLEEDVCFQKKPIGNVKSGSKRSSKENTPRYVD